MMAPEDDIRQREEVDRKVDQFERKLDQLATKADLAKISIQIETMIADAADCFRKAFEGHGAALDRIERTLREMNRKMDQNLRKEPP